MAAIYRFGFEGQQVPAGVSFSGEYAFVQGRAGGSSYACSPSGTGVGAVNVALPIPTSLVFSSHYLKIVNTGSSGMLTDLINFGPVRLAYSASQTRLYLFGNNVFLTSSGLVLPTNVYIPIKCRAHVNTSATVVLDVDGNQMLFSGNSQQGFATLNPSSISFGLGEVGGTRCQLNIDDIAINDNITVVNSTGSWGPVDDATYPPLIRADRVPLIADAPGFGTWLSTDFVASAREVLNGGYPGQYAYSPSVYTEDRFNLQTASANVVGFEGINLYAIDMLKQGGGNPYFTPYITSGSQRFNYDQSYITNTLPSSNATSILRKDNGLPFNLTDYSAMKVGIDSRQFVDANFYGRANLGNVRYTSSVTFTTTDDSDYYVLEYQNLTLDSGATLTVSNRCRGLVIYVKENCIINGVISMNGKGALGTLTGGFKMFKNTTGSFNIMSASLDSGLTLSVEQLFQPIQQGVSSSFGIPQTGAAGGTGVDSVAGNPGSAGTNGQGGGGGSGGTRGGSGQGSLAGDGAAGGCFGGGSGGGGNGTLLGGNATANSGQGGNGYIPGGSGPQGGGGAGNPGGISSGLGGAQSGGNGVGGTIYLIVGNFLYIGGTIQANGLAGGNGGASGGGVSGGGGGGGSGGGPITILYGRNLFNLGTIQSNGGAGGTGSPGTGGGAGRNGGSGGAGSIRIAKLVTL
jgi:hypothetical protein